MEIHQGAGNGRIGSHERYSKGAVPLPERSLIARVRRMAESAGKSRRSGQVIKGIGDDCAVLGCHPGYETLVTTDFSLEGIHFRREWHAPESIGHRCLTRGLSDIAAMGGEPVAAFLSLALPKEVPQSWVTRFTRGFMTLAKKHGVTLAGGDTAESPAGVLADIVVVGRVPQGTAVLRSGARAGDRIFVSGELGGSAAAVQKMMASNRKVGVREYARHFFPEARLALGRALREKELATAMIDTSDGLSTDLSHICEESGVGAEIDGGKIPQATLAGKPVGLDLALQGGEDYELLFTIPAREAIPREMAGVRLTEIGRITKAQGIKLREAGGGVRVLRVKGWEHFRK